MKFKKMWLNINGVDRIIVCNPEKDTLADVVRRLGFTGTKVGCNAGQCGACSVLLDGEVIRACVKKIKNVPEYSKIVTIEGIGTPTNLHPLQQAWITYGGVQCGFCSPGFIVSAKGLLDKNPAPTRQEVREWFHKHHNLCRCTGYKPIVDAVMKAAEVMRGEKTMEDITYKVPEDGRIYGTNFPREAALSKVTGTCDYGDDIALKMPPGTLHVAPVLTGVAHANIKGIDFSEAEKMPGVVKVITAKDIKGSNRLMFPAGHPRTLASGFERPILCDEKVTRKGDFVALVAATTQEQARAAAKAVKLDLEILPEMDSYLEAVKPDAVQIHKEFPNLFCEQPLLKGRDFREVAAESEYVIEASTYSSSQPHNVLEPEVIQAYTDEEGRITVHTKSLALNMQLFFIPSGVGLEMQDLRAIENPTGASFGNTCCAMNGAVAAAATIALDAPVTMTMTYEESQLFTGKRTATYCNGRLACDKDGKITGLEYDMGWDKGGYTEFSDLYVAKGASLMFMMYDVPNISALSRIAVSNNTLGTPYRGSGCVQTGTHTEHLMDIMAEEIGMDPFEFRYKNLLQPGGLNTTNRPYRSGYPFKDMMDKMRPYYEEAKARAKAEDTPEKRRGVGIAWGGFSIGGGIDSSDVALELNPDGSVTNYNTWEDQGQGGDVGSVVITHETLRSMGYDITPDMIKLVQADTGICPLTGPSGGNRQHFMAGGAIIDAAKKLIGAMKKPDGTFRTYDEMVAEGIPTKYGGSFVTVGMVEPYDPNTGEGDDHPSYNWALFLAEVEVDTATGKTKVLSMKNVYDVGIVGSVQAVDGQVYSGLSHGLGFALSEYYKDEKKYNNLLGAGIPQILDVPDDLEGFSMEIYRDLGTHGSVGCAEVLQSSAHMSVINAINNAVGVRIYEVPATPEKVKAAMDAKAAGKEIKQEKYFLGSDLYEELEKIAADPKQLGEGGLAL